MRKPKRVIGKKKGKSVEKKNCRLNKLTKFKECKGNEKEVKKDSPGFIHREPRIVKSEKKTIKEEQGPPPLVLLGEKG